MYHPYFLGYNIFLITGFAFLLTFFLAAEDSDYSTSLQPSLPDVSLVAGHRHQPAPFQIYRQPAPSAQEDRCARAGLCHGEEDPIRYSDRGNIKSTVIFQAIAHSSMIGLGGWLLSLADVPSANCCGGGHCRHPASQSRHRRPSHVRRYHVATSMQELSRLFEMPKEEVSGPIAAWLLNPTLQEYD